MISVVKSHHEILDFFTRTFTVAKLLIDTAPWRLIAVANVTESSLL